MRISYWSSDVCSSDLSRAKRERKLPPGYCSTRARTRCVQIDKRSSCRLRSIPLSLACQSFRSRTSAVSKARPCSSNVSMIAPESSTTTSSVTCRAYGRNLVGIPSLSATFIGTCSDRRLALAIAAEPLSLDALQGEGRVARPAPKDAVAVGRLGAAPQEDQPESVHVVADYETRDAEHHRGDDPAIDRIGRANQGDDRRQQDHHSRFDRAAREEIGRASGRERVCQYV